MTGNAGYIFFLVLGIVPEHQVLVLGVAGLALGILLTHVAFAEGDDVLLVAACQVGIHAPVTCITTFAGFAVQRYCVFGNDVSMTFFALLVGVCQAGDE